MRIESELAIFDRVNKKLDRIGADLASARECRSLREDFTDPRILMKFNDSIGRSQHNIYYGIEGILHDFALTIDDEVPTSPRLHANLLEQMTEPRSSRPAVMRCTEELRDLMRFRHAFRNAYGYEMDIGRLLEILDGVENLILPDLVDGLGTMKVFLESGIGDPEPD